MLNAADLATIKVLYRCPDSLTLYGIPYDMRVDCGQEPRHLWAAYRDYVGIKPGHYGSKRIDISDWIYLGEPGWFSHYNQEEVSLLKGFLEKHAEEIPGNPHEWVRLSG